MALARKSRSPDAPGGNLARRSPPLLLAVVVVVVVTLAGACSEHRDPIVIDEGMLVVENQSSTEWRDVRITLNDHFRGGTRSLAAGGRLTAPLRDFQTGYGQKFDHGRTSVFKVVVTAKEPDGSDVRLHWGRQ